MNLIRDDNKYIQKLISLPYFISKITILMKKHFRFSAFKNSFFKPKWTYSEVAIIRDILRYGPYHMDDGYCSTPNRGPLSLQIILSVGHQHSKDVIGILILPPTSNNCHQQGANKTIPQTSL